MTIGTILETVSAPKTILLIAGYIEQIMSRWTAGLPVGVTGHMSETIRIHTPYKLRLVIRYVALVALVVTTFSSIEYEPSKRHIVLATVIISFFFCCSDWALLQHLGLCETIAPPKNNHLRFVPSYPGPLFVSIKLVSIFVVVYFYFVFHHVYCAYVEKLLQIDCFLHILFHSSRCAHAVIIDFNPKCNFIRLGMLCNESIDSFMVQMMPDMIDSVPVYKEKEQRQWRAQQIIGLDDMYGGHGQARPY